MFAVALLALFLVAGAMVSCSIFARVHRTGNSNHTHHGRQKTCYTPIAGHKNQGHTIAARPLSPLMLPAHVLQSHWLCCCDFTGTFIIRIYYNRCEMRNRALLLRSSSLLQLWQSRQPCVAAAVPVLDAGHAVLSRGLGRDSSSKFGSMKTVVGVGHYLRTLNARVVNSVCDRQL